MEDYARLIHNSACLVGNSSSALREGTFIGVPAVNIGTRQANREHGKNVIHVDYNSTKIQAAIRKQIENGRYEKSTLFGDGRASERISKVLFEAEIKVQKTLYYNLRNGS